MEFLRTDTGSESRLTISGDLDALNASELRVVVDALAADQRKDIVVDLSGLDLIDSSGVAVLIALFKRTRSIGGKMRVAGLRDQPAAVFKLLRLERVFDR